MGGIQPWVSVEPATVPAAILGPLPAEPGTVTYPVPASVVPAGAGGILFFVWAMTEAPPDRTVWWHTSVNVSGGGTNWFSLLLAGGTGAPAGFNSQAFWLPVPADGAVHVTLFEAQIPDSAFRSSIEIHGYSPAA